MVTALFCFQTNREFSVSEQFEVVLGVTVNEKCN
jgi:hypothetical protein